MRPDIGQDPARWNDEWRTSTPELEIRKWDYYGLRPWILKYTPRFGTVVEAGCGLGRWVLYLSRLGIDIEGLDFSKPTIDYLNNWKKINHFNAVFTKGDVTKLPYKDKSLSGYISLGVVEHFIEGPYRPLREAHRVLKPGGIAIITTPSISWLLLFRKIKTRIKNVTKLLIGRKVLTPPFFQYEYRPRKLSSFVSDSGLIVTNYGAADILYTFCEFGGFTGKNLDRGSFAYWFSNTFENTFVNKIGAQSITIAVKVDDTMHCFLCGKRYATQNSLKMFDVPVCDFCMRKENAFFYSKGKKPKYNLPYIFNPEFVNSVEEFCEYCGVSYKTDEIFEYFGFSKKVCSSCLKEPSINIELSNYYVKPVWRNRKLI